MPYVWKRAVLQRTRLSDSQFIGDLLAVICEFSRFPRRLLDHRQQVPKLMPLGFESAMCASALKSGTPLPQVTPGPLVERLVSGNLKISTGPVYAGLIVCLAVLSRARTRSGLGPMG